MSDVSDVIERAQAWLEQNSGQFFAETEDGRRFKDNFLELLILEITGNWRIVDLKIPRAKWNYFGGEYCVDDAAPVHIMSFADCKAGEAVGTVGPYPDDIDTQSIANTIIKPVDATANHLLDEILLSENEDGIIPVHYDDKARPRVCVEACANVCTFFYLHGRGHEVRNSFNFVFDTLKTRDFGVKRYYSYVEPLLFYTSRLVRIADDPELVEMRDILKECVKEQVGQKGNSIRLALRLLVCQQLGVENKVDLHSLVALQENDGSFGVAWYYNFGKSKIRIGHKAFTCAFSMEAIKRSSK